MVIQAIVFDVGGVLEITPDLGVTAKWEQRLHLAAGEMDKRLYEVWRGGSIGTISEQDVHRGIHEIIGMSTAQVDAFMQDIWQEYLGTPNTELIEYFRSLRPRFQTAFLCNSFVGARQKEQERYHFDELCDLIIYSHEVGLWKPDARIYALTCERLGRQPAEVIFLDNLAPNVEAACQIGMHGILFKDNAQAIADIQACIQDNASGES
jgi:epoxide hydrolase-like predicted phosphatase